MSVTKTTAVLWHEARYEALMRRARIHTVVAGRAYEAGQRGRFLAHQRLAAARIDQAAEHGRRADLLRDRPNQGAPDGRQ